MDPQTIGKKLKQYYPQYAQLDDAELGQKYIAKFGASIEAVKSGQLKVKDLPANQQIAVGAFANEAGIPAPKEAISAEAEKRETKLSDVDISIDVLEKQLTEVKGRGRFGGTIGKLLAGATGGEYATDTADYEALRKSMIGPLARAISGEVGVLTDRDISRAEGLLPKPTDAKKLAKKKLDNLRALVNAKRSVGGRPSLADFEE